MEWKIAHVKESGIILTVVTGTVTAKELETLTIEQLSLAKSLNVNRFLSEYKNTDRNISIAEIHDLPKVLTNAGQTIGDKFAIVYSPDSPYAAMFEFFDTRCFNTALNNRVFTDYDVALQWLVDDSK